MNKQGADLAIIIREMPFSYMYDVVCGRLTSQYEPCKLLNLTGTVSW